MDLTTVFVATGTIVGLVGAFALGLGWLVIAADDLEVDG
jgi:hypothetical protein